MVIKLSRGESPMRQADVARQHSNRPSPQHRPSSHDGRVQAAAQQNAQQRSTVSVSSHPGSHGPGFGGFPSSAQQQQQGAQSMGFERYAIGGLQKNRSQFEKIRMGGMSAFRNSGPVKAREAFGECLL